MFILTSSYPDHGPSPTGCGLLGDFFRLLLGGACTVRDLCTASQGDAHGEVGGSFGKDPEPIIIGVLGCAFVPLLPRRNEVAALKWSATWDRGRVDQLDREPEIQYQLWCEVVLVVEQHVAVGHALEEGDEGALDLLQFGDVSLGNHAAASCLLQNRVDDVLADLGLCLRVHEDGQGVVLLGSGRLVLRLVFLLVLFLALLLSQVSGAWAYVRVVHVVQNLNLEVKVVPVMLGLRGLDPGRGEPAHAPVVGGKVLTFAGVPPWVVVPGSTRRADAFHILVDLLRYNEVGLVAPVLGSLVRAPLVGSSTGEAAAARAPGGVLSRFLDHEESHVVLGHGSPRCRGVIELHLVSEGRGQRGAASKADYQIFQIL